MECIVNAAIIVLLSANVGVQMVDSVCDMQAAGLCSEAYVEKASSLTGSVHSMCTGIAEMKACIGQATNSCDGRERQVIEEMLFHVLKIETAHCNGVKDDEIAHTTVYSDCDLMAVVECSEKYATDLQEASGPQDPAEANDMIAVVCKATWEANACLTKQAEACKENLAFQELFTQLQATYKSSCSDNCSPAKLMKCVEPLQKPPEGISDMCRVYKEYLTCYNDLIDSCGEEQKKHISETEGFSDLQSMIDEISKECRDIVDQDKDDVPHAEDRNNPRGNSSVITPGKFPLLVIALLILVKAILDRET